MGLERLALSGVLPTEPKSLRLWPLKYGGITVTTVSFIQSKIHCGFDVIVKKRYDSFQLKNKNTSSVE